MSVVSRASTSSSGSTDDDTGHASSIVAATAEQQTPDWFKSAVFYEVLVRSFRDSNADGTGDRLGFKGRSYDTIKGALHRYDDAFSDYWSFLEPRLVEARQRPAQSRHAGERSVGGQPHAVEHQLRRHRGPQRELAGDLVG